MDLEILSYELMAHKLNDKLTPVSDALGILSAGENIYDDKTRKKAEEAIEKARIQFRGFLRIILEDGKQFELPESFPRVKLRTIYEKSDFNWNNLREYEEFQFWYVNYVRMEVEG